MDHLECGFVMGHQIISCCHPTAQGLVVHLKNSSSGLLGQSIQVLEEDLEELLFQEQVHALLPPGAPCKLIL